MLASILQEAGYKTGLYTSPHLKDFRERIRINGEMIAESFVIDFTEKIKPHIEDIEPSFFEITVAMAFEYFALQEIDIAVIETGLGGRLDSTNVIIPELSIITNIGWDHMNLLGDTLEKIASEKAGIIKDMVPVVIGEVIDETKDIFHKIAFRKNAPLSIATDHWQVMDWRWDKHELIIEVAEKDHVDHLLLRVDLPGIYQSKNILTVLESIKQLKKREWTIYDENIKRGLAHVKKSTGLHGRWEVIRQSPTVVLDVAHNIDGINQLLRQIELSSHHNLHLVFGMVKDKEVESILKLLPNTAQYYFCNADIPRALPAQQLASLAAKYELKGSIHTDVNLAINAAIQHAHIDDLILVFGSVYLIGEVNL